MAKLIDIVDVIAGLNAWHARRRIKVLDYQSDIVGKSFPGNFNVSGYHDEILSLPDQPGKFWGVDKCLRVDDVPDRTRLQLFHMGIYAEAVDLHGVYQDPFSDATFIALQKRVLHQFFSCIRAKGVSTTRLEATYLGGATFGGTPRMPRTYTFPEDVVSRFWLDEAEITARPVYSQHNIDLREEERSLVGPSVEVACRGTEIATIVFDCFRVRRATPSSFELEPINYVGGYAIGIERLAYVASEIKDVYVTSSLLERRSQLIDQAPAAETSLFGSETYAILAGEDALAAIEGRSLSDNQERLANVLRKQVAKARKTLGA